MTWDSPPCRFRVVEADRWLCACRSLHTPETVERDGQKLSVIRPGTCQVCPFADEPRQKPGRPARRNAHYPLPAGRVPDRIDVGMATIRCREPALRAAVRSLLDQTWRPTTLTVYLNDWPAVPDWLAALAGGHEAARGVEVRAILAQDAAGDLGSLGKFWGTTLGSRGYHLTVDDDIDYPPDYVETLVRRVDAYRRDALIGVHGVTLARRVESYLRDRTVFSFTAQLRHDRPVHVLGTGTLAWHAETADVRLDAFREPNVDDPQLAAHLERLGVPRIIVARPQGWLRTLPTPVGSRIGYQQRLDDALPTSYLAGIDWPDLPERIDPPKRPERVPPPECRHRGPPTGAVVRNELCGCQGVEAVYRCGLLGECTLAAVSSRRDRRPNCLGCEQAEA